MDGDFKGDFTRDSASKLGQFTRVLMQQGRVQLDADWNEQADILLYALRTLITDLIGPHWGTIGAEDISITVVGEEQNKIPKITITTAKDPNSPDSTDSFKIQPSSTGPQRDFVIGKGHYYVDGILCENSEKNMTYQSQKIYPLETPSEGSYLVYLDVWERQITALEDENIREIALGTGEPDTATRARVVWQVKVIDAAKPPFTISNADIKALDTEKIQKVEDWTKKLQSHLQPDNRGELKAWGKVAADQEIDACITPSEARYRGAENQLYRVEIHKGGGVGEATFKWSRENGCVVFPVLDIKGETVFLGNLGREDRLSLHEGDWVEVVDDAYILQVSGNTTNNAQIHPLLQVKSVDRLTGQVTLNGTPKITIKEKEPTRHHPLLRRWDQKPSPKQPKKSGAPEVKPEDGIKIEEGEGTAISLEDGIQIQFQAPYKDKNEPANLYRTGDYWLIPARTATGDVMWLQEIDEKTGKPFLTGHPQAMSPNGVGHHYALLALMAVQNGNVPQVTDLRYVVPPLAKVMALFLQH